MILQRLARRRAARHGPRNSAPGFTLLEVILALAILAGAIAMLTEALRGARRNGQIAARLTVAELVAASKMSEFVAQITPLAATSDAPSETEADCTYSVSLEATPIEGLVAVTVTARAAVPGETRAAEFTLVRWLPDPNTQVIPVGSTTEPNLALPTSASSERE